MVELNPVIGMPVLWYPHADTKNDPTPGFVTTVFGCTLGITLVARHSSTLRERTGVRHINDPVLKQNYDLRTENGGWDYVESDKLMLQAFKDLRHQIDGCSAQINGLKGQLQVMRNKSGAPPKTDLKHLDKEFIQKTKDALLKETEACP